MAEKFGGNTEGVYKPEDEGTGKIYKPENPMKVVGKIDLSQFEKKPKKLESRNNYEKKENYNEMLNLKLKEMSERVNNSFGHFLQSDGSIDMESSSYRFSDKENDRQTIKTKEETFAAGKGQTREKWLEDRENARGIVTEKALTLVLDKILGDDFIIARSSALDDYSHGVDTLIVDKKTGAPICGMDEMGAIDNRGYSVKGSKIYDIINKYNGTFIKYGATFRNGELQCKSIKNVPTFYLSLDENDLDKVLPAIANDEISEVEASIFQRLLHSLDSQIATYYKEHTNLKENLFDVKKALLLEQDDLKDTFGDEGWGRTDEGREWKRRMGQNNLRLNILNFQKSLQKMKETCEKIKK
ncbi:MAG: hypothetical protein WCJ57_01955 [Candidatus Falkowbacteria bacterium]